MSARKNSPTDGAPVDGDAASRDAPSAESFEAVYARLEQSVHALEEGNLSLDEALRLYEEGARLAQRCAAMLDAAELRVTRLRNRYSGVSAEAEQAESAEQ